MIGVYFSGTGNTKHCVEKFLNKCDKKSKIVSIEDSSVIDEIKMAGTIVFAYPIYWSNLPKIVSDFIIANEKIWRNKKIFIITTMGLFSGDGAGCSARLFKKYSASVIGGLHLKMPDCIGDVKLLKKPIEQNKALVKAAESKIDIAARRFKDGKPPHNGLGIFRHIAGLFGQRLWFYHETKEYTGKLKINAESCVGCEKCVSICPMNNIEMKENKATSKNCCTKCYRCISNCPQKAITLLGKEVFEQSKIENYID